jgi:hypothetical protein
MSRLQIGFLMASNSGDGESPRSQNGEGSQDALRHQKDAVHHKLHLGASDQKNDQQAQGIAKPDSVAQGQIQEQQAEIPKVASPASLIGRSDV